MLPLCEYISTPSCLTELMLVESTEFREDTLQLLISAIPCAKSLIHLDLSFNQFYQSDVEMLSVVLSVNSTFKDSDIRVVFNRWRRSGTFGHWTRGQSRS